MASAALQRGLLRLPGVTPQSLACTQRLLTKDFKEHHAMYANGFHNHLPHFLLAAYDLGAPPSVLEKIYEGEARTGLRPFSLPGSDRVTISRDNWTQFLGKDVAYAAYVRHFEDEIKKYGVSDTVKRYVFDKDANVKGVEMLVRLVSGALHPIIQIGYGLEFGDDQLVVSGLAQAALHQPTLPDLYRDILDGQYSKQTDGPTLSLLAALKQFYESDALKPVMPYDPNALLSKRFRDAFADSPRGPEIAKIASRWNLSPSSDLDPKLFWEQRIEEVIWTVVLLLFGTSKPGHAPRLDFFIMHMVTSSIFLPSFFDKVFIGPNDDPHRKDLLQVYLRTVMALLVIRGRPKIDAVPIMRATAYPKGPAGSARETEERSHHAWAAILRSIIHAPEAHLVKTVRTLAYAAQKLGHTPAGAVPGAQHDDGKEVLPGLMAVDGSLFVRCAGVAMDVLGWVDLGDEEGEWDRSGMGWDDAWK